MARESGSAQAQTEGGGPGRSVAGKPPGLAPEAEGPAVRLREATEGDLSVLSRIEREVFAGQAWDEPTIRAELSGPGRYYVVAERDDGAVGYAGARIADDADIMTVGVLPAEQGRGIGRRLARALIDVASRAGARSVFLEVQVDNDVAIGLYRSLGFESISRRRHYYGPGRHATVMRLELRPAGRPVGSP